MLKITRSKKTNYFYLTLLSSVVTCFRSHNNYHRSFTAYFHNNINNNKMSDRTDIFRNMPSENILDSSGIYLFIIIYFTIINYRFLVVNMLLLYYY